MLILQKVTVREANNLHLNPSLIVSPEEDFTQVVKRFASSPELRGVFVADAGNRLIGVITRADLLDWTQAKLGISLGAKAGNLQKVLRLASLMNADTAGDVMHSDSHRAAVSLDDTLARALRLMAELDLIVLPVVDDDYRIIGDLKLSELLLRSTGQADGQPQFTEQVMAQPQPVVS